MSGVLESNPLGVSGKTNAVGSGGWLNIIDKFYKAKAYFDFVSIKACFSGAVIVMMTP